MCMRENKIRIVGQQMRMFVGKIADFGALAGLKCYEDVLWQIQVSSPTTKERYA